MMMLMIVEWINQQRKSLSDFFDDYHKLHKDFSDIYHIFRDIF